MLRAYPRVGRNINVVNKNRIFGRDRSRGSAKVTPTGRIVPPYPRLPTSCGSGARRSSRRHDILAPLGIGEIGEIYKHVTRIDCIVAIKIRREALFADPQFRDRFEREVRAISKRTHPHICPSCDIARQDLTD